MADANVSVTVTGPTGPSGFLDEIYKRYVTTSMRQTEDDVDLVVIPGETDVDPVNYSVGSKVELACPICQNAMIAVIMEISGSGNSVSQHYKILNKQCECPDVYFIQGSGYTTPRQ